MVAIMSKVKRLARRNKLFRVGLIGVYVIVYTLCALWRELWRARKKLAACVIVFALCSSRFCLAVAYAEEAGVSGNNVPPTENAESSAGIAGEQAGEDRTDDAWTEGNSGGGESELGKGETSADEEGSKENPGDGGSASGETEVPGDVPGDGDQSEENPGDGGSASGETEVPGDGDQDEKNPGDGSGVQPGGDAGSDEPSEDGGDADEKNPGDGSGVQPGGDTGADEPSEDGGDAEGKNPEGGSEQPGGDAVSGDPSVSGNDESGENPGDGSEQPGGDTGSEELSVSENDPSADGGAVSDNDLPPVYIPLLAISYQMSEGPAGVLMGNASALVNVSTAPSYIEPGEDGEPGVSPAVCVWADLYGETRRIDLAETGMADIAFPEDFYGAITLTAEDELGNVYTEVTPTLLVDTGTPSAGLTETELKDGTKQVCAVFRESGYTATGIAGVRCFIDGTEIGMDGYKPENIVENCFGQGVISGASLPLEAEQAGRYTVRLEVWDHAGNTASYTQEAYLPAKRGPISVAVSGGTSLTIAPWDAEEQVYSDEFTLENQSGYDIIATLAYAKVSVEHGILPKDCSLFLSGDVFEAIALPEGETEKLFRVRIPAKKEDGETNGSLTMRLHGSISEGSEMLWEDGDVKVEMRFDYEAVPVE